MKVPMCVKYSASSRNIVPDVTPRSGECGYFTHSMKSPRPDSGMLELKACDSR